MLRYVHRRLKEIAEKTYTILDAKRSWTCEKSTLNKNGSEQLCNRSSSKKPNAVTIFQAPAHEAIRSKQQESSQGGEEKCHHKEQSFCYQETWLSALTWSGALICGWYASQMLCLHRRHRGWDSRCYYSRMLMQSGRAIHSKLFTHVVFASPFRFGIHSSDESSTNIKQQRRNIHHYIQVEEVGNDDSGIFSPKPSDEERRRRTTINPELFESHEESFDLSNFILKINGDDDERDFNQTFVPNFTHRQQQDRHQQQNRSESTKTEGSNANNNQRTVSDAAKELQKILGEIEFELGVKAAAIGDFAQSFSHFKLATAHEHSGATFNLGVCFEQGIGVKQDMHMAMECYDAAARLGHPKAMYNLGVFYASGLGGLRKNRKAARRCFVAAAQLGQIEARIALGMSIVSQDNMAQSTPPFAVSPIDCAINHIKPVLVS